jgi:hypothetical protein
LSTKGAIVENRDCSAGKNSGDGAADCEGAGVTDGKATIRTNGHIEHAVLIGAARGIWNED